MSDVKRVLVAGGGIGGLTAGVALRQAGIAVDLVEIAPTFTVYGVGIIQPNNTLRALDRVGLAARCVELGSAFPGWRVHDAVGKKVMDAPNLNTAAPSFPPNNGITRRALQTVLLDAARAEGVEIRLGTCVSEIVQDGPEVRVKTSDGAESVYDLLVGCDGLYSDMRRRTFPDAPAPRFTGQAVWRYNFPRARHLEWGEIYSGPSSKVGLVPMSKELMYMFLVTPEPGNRRLPKEKLAELMRARIVGFGGIVAELAASITDPDEVVYKPMENLLLPTPWNRGRVLIIGDAAHATTPQLAQGAAMAIEDAVLLGELLRRDASTEDVLAEFMRRRFGRAKFVIDSSERIAGWELQEWRGIHDPEARPGETLHRATLKLLEDF